MKFQDRIKELRRVPAAELIPNPKNWRTHPQMQRDALEAIMADVGVADVLLARETPEGLQLIDGHLRADLLDQDVPVVVLDVTEQEADKLLVSLDPLASMAESDLGQLRALLEQVSDLPLDLRDFLEASNPEPSNWRDAKATKFEPPDEPITKPGDLWSLGKHRLICGDCTDAKTVDRLMAGEYAALVHTDPPYSVEYRGHERPGKGKDWGVAYKEIPVAEIAKQFEQWISLALKFSHPRVAFYIWHGLKQRAVVHEVLARHKMLLHQEIIWNKKSSLIGFSSYNIKHETAYLAWVKGSKPLHNKGTGSHSSVWEFEEESHQARIHPAQKPVELFALPMRAHTKRGAICFEPFCGSGSQIIAAEQEGRRCFAIELEPVFVDACIWRWEQTTGKKAKRIKK